VQSFVLFLPPRCVFLPIRPEVFCHRSKGFLSQIKDTSQLTAQTFFSPPLFSRLFFFICFSSPFTVHYSLTRDPENSFRIPRLGVSRFLEALVFFYVLINSSNPPPINWFLFLWPSHPPPPTSSIGIQLPSTRRLRACFPPHSDSPVFSAKFCFTVTTFQSVTFLKVNPHRLSLEPSPPKIFFVSILILLLSFFSVSV